MPFIITYTKNYCINSESLDKHTRTWAWSQEQ